eukprot:SAG31_NODE_2084_length_6489_cov_7.773239_1_plen_23_part_10
MMVITGPDNKIELLLKLLRLSPA